MKNILSTKQKSLTVLVSVFASVLLVAISVFAATTIGTNITTTGSLSVTGASTLTGAVTSAGNIIFGSDTTTTTEARFLELTGGGTNYVGMKASDAITANVIWTLPSADGTANQTLVTNGSGALSWASGLTTALTAGNIFVGNASNVATPVAMSGDITISNAGVSAIGAGKVTNAMIAAAAGIPYSKLTIADAELAIVKTSGLQAALDLKSPLASPTFTGTVTLPSGQVLIAPALGTPASGVLTNATGLPAASVLAGSFGTGAYVMGSSLQVSTIELGHATDTTIARSGAGAITVEGTAVLLRGGDAGTPSALVGTNISGTGASFTAGAVTTGTVTSTMMAAGAKTHTVIIPVPDPGAADADIAAGYVLWTPSVAVTITKVYTAAETAWIAAASANDATVTVTNAAIGAVATLNVVTALAAGSNTDMGSITNGAVVAGTNVTIAVTANGTANAPRQNIQIEYTTTN